MGRVVDEALNHTSSSFSGPMIYQYAKKKKFAKDIVPSKAFVESSSAATS